MYKVQVKNNSKDNKTEWKVICEYPENQKDKAIQLHNELIWNGFDSKVDLQPKKQLQLTSK